MNLKLKNLLFLSEKGYSVPKIVDINEVKSDKYYAVRSNSCNEDSFLSHAGIYETRLFVTKDNIKTAVRDVTLNAGDCFIQEMITDPDYSGVILTKENEIIVNITNGLCEGITSGHITGVIYKFKRENYELLKKFGFQEKEMIFNGSNIVEQINKIPNFSSDIDEIKKHALLGNVLSALFEMNTDIEFTVKNGELFILQCRRLNQ